MGPARDLTYVLTRAAGISHYPTIYNVSDKRVGQASKSVRLYTSNTYFMTLGKMPPPTATESIEQEGRIVLAMDALQKGSFTSARAAAKAYDVSRSTLQYRINGHPMQRNRRSPNCKLTATEELILVR